MNKPSKKDIKAAIEGLKSTPAGEIVNPGHNAGGNLAAKKTSKRIRKQGV